MPPIVATSPLGTTYLEVSGQAYPVMACTLPDISWEPIQQASAPGGRRLGPARYGALTVRFAPPAMGPLAGWLDGLTAGRIEPVDLGVLHADGDGKVRDHLLLKACVLTALRFPECTAAGKDVYAIEAVFQIEGMAVGPVGAPVKAPMPGRTKNWMASNFAVSVPGLPTGRISRIGAVTLERCLVRDDGGRLGAWLPAGALTVSPLTLGVTGPDCMTWRDAVLKLTLGGGHGDPLVVGVELRDANLKTVLATLSFQAMALSGFGFDPDGGAGGVATATVRFELETLKFRVN